jgi:hypothetical protein
VTTPWLWPMPSAPRPPAAFRRRPAGRPKPGAPPRPVGSGARVVQTAVNSTSERYSKLLPLTILEPHSP